MYVKKRSLDSFSCHRRERLLLAVVWNSSVFRHSCFLPFYSLLPSLFPSLMSDGKTVAAILLLNLASAEERTAYIQQQSNDSKATALSFAAKHGNLSLVELLLNCFSHEAATNCIFAGNLEGKGDTALHFACENGHTKVVQLLISFLSSDGQRHKYLRFYDKSRKTVLMSAAKGGHVNIARLLLDQLPSPQAKQDYILHCSPSMWSYEGYPAGFHAARGEHGYSTLFHACMGGYSSMVSFLMDYLPSLEMKRQFASQKGSDDTTALFHVSAESSEACTQIVTALLDCFPTPQMRDDYIQTQSIFEETALFTAASYETPILLHLLLSACSSTEARLNYIQHVNDEGRTAFFNCREGQTTSALLRYLPPSEEARMKAMILHEDSNHKNAFMTICSDAQNASALSAFLETLSSQEEKHKCILHQSSNGSTALFSACENSNHELVIEFLLNALPSDESRQACILHKDLKGRSVVFSADIKAGSLSTLLKHLPSNEVRADFVRQADYSGETCLFDLDATRDLKLEKICMIFTTLQSEAARLDFLFHKAHNGQTAFFRLFTEFSYIRDLPSNLLECECIAPLLSDEETKMDFLFQRDLEDHTVFSFALANLVEIFDFSEHLNLIPRKCSNLNQMLGPTFIPVLLNYINYCIVNRLDKTCKLVGSYSRSMRRRMDSDPSARISMIHPLYSLICVLSTLCSHDRSFIGPIISHISSYTESSIPVSILKSWCTVLSAIASLPLHDDLEMIACMIASVGLDERQNSMMSDTDSQHAYHHSFRNLEAYFLQFLNLWFDAHDDDVYFNDCLPFDLFYSFTSTLDAFPPSFLIYFTVHNSIFLS